MKNKNILRKNNFNETSFDNDFFNDVLGLFPDASGRAPKAGGCGKYLYAKGTWEWDSLCRQDRANDAYYVLRAERVLLNAVRYEIADFGIPPGTPYIDFGVGGKTSFLKNAAMMAKAIKASTYLGIDLSEKALEDIQALADDFKDAFVIKTKVMDLFRLTTKILSPQKPALGVMNGITLGNAYGLVKNTDNGPDGPKNITALLGYLSQLCGHGWLLVSVDTNQNTEALEKAYNIPSIQFMNKSLVYRMEKELPVDGFDPSLFAYAPTFDPPRQSLVHLLEATAPQDFLLGPHAIHVDKGQQLHVHDSYKLRTETVDACFRQAQLDLLKKWEHPTGIAVCLLRDRALGTSPINQNTPLATAKPQGLNPF